MAGVDFSLRTYSYDDTPGDLNLTKFSLSHEDIKWKIPFIQAATKLSQKKLKFFASAWTAPKWMKTNGDFKGNGMKQKKRPISLSSECYTTFITRYTH